MSTTRNARLSRVRAERGASAVEYALIVGGAGAALMLGVAVLSAATRTVFEASAAGINAAATEAAVAPDVDPPAPAPSPSDVPSLPASPAPTPSPSPSPSSVSPTPTAGPASPSLAPTRPDGAIDVRRGDDADKQDVGANKGSKDLAATVDPPGAAEVEWDSGDLVLVASETVPRGTVITVRWSYTQGNKPFSGTLVYWVR